MDPAMLQDVTDEVERLHRFFVDWLGGRAAGSDEVFQRGFYDVFDERFQIVQPDGTVRALRALGAGLRRAHGANPAFQIEIRHVRVVRSDGPHVLAIYEEWQRNSSSPRPDNGRISSVWFHHDGERLRWVHLQETWLPDAVTNGGNRVR